MRGNLADPANGNPLLVVDSWPVMEWLKECEPVMGRFDSLLALARVGDVKLIMSNINFGEVYYNTWIWWDEIRAEKVLLRFETLPIQIIHPTRDELLKAAQIKGIYNCSYADAFGVVLAIEFQCPVISGDKDFSKVEQGGLIDVEWWGK